MGYVLKTKKGIKFTTGRKSRGGCLRTQGNRVQVFEKKKTAQDAKKYIINRWAKNGQIPKDKKKAFSNRIVIKKI